MTLRVDFVDYSHHQSGPIDYDAYLRAGGKALIHKATEGSTYVDPNYTLRRVEAARKGIPFGAYHFSRHEAGDAITEARAFLAVANPRPGDIRPTLDIETTEGMSLAQLRDWAARWVAYVRDQVGAWPMVYTPFDLQLDDRVIVWRPRYNKTETPPDLPWDIWQWASDGRVAGFPPCDVNMMRRGLTLEAMRIPKPEPKPAAVKIASWNIGDGSDRSKYEALNTLEERGASIIDLQEAGDRGLMLQAWCKRHKWEIWFGEGEPGAASVPILWNPRQVTEKFSGTTPATPRTNVGDPGAGPEWMKAKVWNRVRFEDDLLVINGHIVPSVHLGPREALAREEIRVLAEMVERRERLIKQGLGVVITGDFNMPPEHPLTRPLRDLGMTQRTTDPTFDKRTIDHVWTLGVRGPVDVVAMPRDDHDSPILTIKE